jgi:Trk K+ transport system NAD-binding subunit
VCGLDGVALRTIEQLHLAGVAVVVVDEAAEGPGAQVVAGWGIARIAGSPRRREVLGAAGLAGAVAVVCVQDEDLHALETALLVHRLRPDVRVVAALSNPSVGTAVADLIGPGSVLDVAALAAPSVVEACLRRREHRLEVEGVAFVAAEVDPDVAGTLRELYGDLAPIAVVPGGEENEIVVCPGRDHQVHPGDLVTVFGTAEDVAPRLAGTHRPQAVVLEGRSSAAVRVLSAPLRLARTLAGESDRAIRLTLGILVAVLALSVLLLRIGYRKPDGAHMTVLDAMYFTIETVGTIGYGDYYFAAQATWLRVYAVVLMIVGATLATILFALLTNLLVSRRIAESMGRRTVGRLSGHAIVIGLGSVGVRVVEGLLAEGRHVVVVDRDEDNRYLSQVRALGVPVVIADATQRATLRAVGLGAASSVAVLTSDDLVNIETGLAVRAELAGRWGEVPVVLRVFDTSLGETVEEGFGFDDVRSTSQLAAPWFVGAALGLSVLGTFYVERTPFLIARLVVAANGGLDGLAMQELSARTRVVAIRRARTQGLEHPPRSGTRFQAGDEAYIVGPYSELLQVLRRDGASVSQPASGGQDAPALQGRDQVADGVQLQ